MIGTAKFVTVGLNPAEQVLALCGRQDIAPSCTHMIYPNYGIDPSKRHYLYVKNTGWVDYKDAVIASGVYETYATHTDGRSLIHFWWDRSLSAEEQAALSSAAFKAIIAASAGVDAADITITNAAISSNTGYCFYLTVDTTKAGSANDTFDLPSDSSSTYSYEVSWGDGNIERVTANTPQTHLYSAPGTYTVAIRGVFPQVYFNDAGDKLKLIGLQLGDVGWTSFANAFYGCANLVTMTGPANTAAVTNMSSMFGGCTAFNQSVANFDTALVTDMSYMFWNCAVFNQSVANFNTAAVKYMNGMFSGCTAFNQSVANFDTWLVTDMSAMFQGCTAFKQSLATFNMEVVSNLSDMCDGCDLNTPGTTTNYDNTLIAWAAQDLVDVMPMTFGTSKYCAGAAARQAIIGDDSWTIVDGGLDYTNGFWLTVDTTKDGSAADTFVLPLPEEGVYDYTVDWGEGGAVERSILNLSLTHIYAAPGTYTIKIAGTFPQVLFDYGGDCLKLIGLQLGDVGWTSFVNAFDGCANLVALTGPANTAAVTDMSAMFADCAAFNQSVANFNTAAVTNMNAMFIGCTAFNQSVANFDTALVTNMNMMFQDCAAFNQSVANFNTALVTSMSSMFSGCSAFKQSLATFNMEAVVALTDMCAGCDLNAPATTTNYDATLIAWAAQDLVDSLTMTFGTSKYSAGAAATARQAIIDDDSWTILDGGVGP